MTKSMPILMLIVFFLSGCFFSKEDKTIIKQSPDLGSMPIKYYSNKSVTSLEIPPDLTKPDFQNSFRISEFVDTKENYVNLTNKELLNEKVLALTSKVEVKKSGTRRWLIVDKPSDIIWSMTQEFLKSEGFAIKEINKKTGIIETDYLENRPDLPDRSVGLIRSLIQKATGQSYSLPVLDMYRVRVEPINENTTEVHFSISSMQEVVQYDPQNIAGKEEKTLWQAKERDPMIEVEMLYRFMVFLGADQVKEKIINATNEKSVSARLDKNLNGYSKLIFEHNILDTWDFLSWGLDGAKINIEDKDLKERSIYINVARTADKGIFSNMFGDDAILMTFQLALKESSPNKTEVLFYDISEKNEQETIEFSFDLFNEILEQYK